MIDVRYKIKELAEQTLESFVRFRLIDLCIEDEWKTGLTDFVSEESKDHLANYKDLYDFLQNNNEQDVTLEQMDITTLSALVLHYPKWEGICKVSTGSKKLFINHVKQMRELRNSIVHNKEKLTELNLEILYYDQLYFSSCIANFAVLVMKYKKPSEEWKLIYHKAKAIESQLQGERWFAIDSVPNSILHSDEDLSDLIDLAEQGQVEAELKLGKVYYYGQRVKKDRGKALYWFSKAAEQQNIVASCYLAEFYTRKDVDTIWDNVRSLLKSYAEQGCAPAQYEYGMMLLFDKYSPKDYIKWIEESAKQDYPEALAMLSVLYLYDKTNREKSKDLSLKAANLGHAQTCLALAKSELMQGNYNLALQWCNRAKTQDVDELKRIKAEKERIMRKKEESQ